MSACVYVIDDSSEVRRSIHDLLDAMGHRSWPFASARDFLDQLPALAPAPILLDLRMPELDGLQLLALLAERGVDWPVIMVTGFGDVSVAVSAMKLGALDFLEKPFDPRVLEAVLDAAFAQVAASADAHRRRQAARERLERLTGREAEVVDLLMRGSPNKRIAFELGISVRTAEMHRANALAKLGVKSVAELAALANDARRDHRNSRRFAASN